MFPGKRSIMMILLVLILKFRFAFPGKCIVSIATMSHVPACPQNERDWNLARKRKNCESLAKLQTCDRRPKQFTYHCVMNAWANGTIEVCAPVRFSQGYCVQFSHFEGRLKDNEDIDCTKFSDPCPRRYRSDMAFKYSRCYDHVRKLHTNHGHSITVTNISQAGQPTQRTTLKNSSSELGSILILVLVVAFTIVENVILITCCIIHKRKSRNRRRLRNRNYVGRTNSSEMRTENTRQFGEQAEPFFNDEVPKTEYSSGSEDDSKNKDGTTQMPSARDDKTQMDGSNGLRTASGINDTPMSILQKTHSIEASTSLQEQNCGPFAGIQNLKGYTDLAQFKDGDKYYIETKMYNNIIQKLEREHIVVITGNPWCGKTITAIHMALKYASIGWTIEIETKIKNINRLFSEKKREKTLLLIDNLFDEMCDIDTLNLCRNALNDIYKEISELFRIVITTKKNLIHWANECIGHKGPIHILDEKHQFTMSSKDFSIAEKKKILECQLHFAEYFQRLKRPSLKQTEIEQIVTSESHIGYVLCANLYAFDKRYQTVQFFSNQSSFLKEQIKAILLKDKSKGSETLFLLFFIYTTHLHQDKCDVSDKTKCKENVRKFIDTSKLNFDNLVEMAGRLQGSFFTEVDKYTYVFAHKSVNEAVQIYVFEAYFDQMCAHSLLSIDVVKSQVFMKDSGTRLPHFEIAAKYYKSLSFFIKYQVLNGKVSDICEAKFLHDETFTCSLYSIMTKWKLKDVIEFLTTRNKSKIDCPMPFWMQRSGGRKFIASLIEYVEEAKKKVCVLENENLEKKMSLLPYFTLFGELFARTSEQFIAKQMHKGYDEESIKLELWNFRDESGYTTLHLLILSEKSNESILTIIESMADDNLRVDDQSNKYQYTPIMSAINHPQVRLDVIRELVARGANLHLKDIRGNTAFHHCVKTNKHDLDCFQILQILFDKCPDLDINTCNNADQTILNLAAMQAKFSRILCILLILERGCDATSLDWRRASPIYHTVFSLKSLEGLQKTERLLRVSILMLNNDDPYINIKDGKCALTLCKEHGFEALEGLFACDLDQKTMANFLHGHVKMPFDKKKSEKYAHLLSNFEDSLKELILVAIANLSQTSLL